MGMSGNGGGIVHLHSEIRLGEPNLQVDATGAANGNWYDPTKLVPIDPAQVYTPTDTLDGWVAQSQWDAQAQCATGDHFGA
jgi:hypothetical protein